MGPRAPRSSRPSSPRAAHEGSKLIFGSSSRSRVSIARASHQRPRSLQTRAARREAPKLPGSQAQGPPGYPYGIALRFHRGPRRRRSAAVGVDRRCTPAARVRLRRPRSHVPQIYYHRTASPAGGSPGHGSRLPNGRGRAGQAHQRGWAMAGGIRRLAGPTQSELDSPAAANEGASLLQAPVSSSRL